MKKLKRYQYERYAVLCNLAYSRVLKQTRYGFAPNGQRVIANRFGKPMIRVLWANDNEEVIVVIKGSHNPWDWLLNLALWKRHCKALGLNYAIHAGYYYLIFQESLPLHKNDRLGASVYEQLTSIIVPLIEQGKKITFTGHSSGGAIGCVLADALEKQFPKSIKRVVTFGQPSIGGYGFKNRYTLGHKTYRICCDLDIVTFLPPLPLFYWHVGKMLWLYNGRIYENTPTLMRLGRSIGSWLIRPFSYHLMTKYIRNKDFFDER
ncbi:lipase [Vibrio sp. Isolate25]|uniref:lipase family protein n=1 Tax=Vibrio TaxID=662 RepID=UPI001EFEDF47|nr:MULTISPECIES: lipase [Vibrio]MCG9595657.1 lipase [Vibrio sp. Isolate25]MCG9677154.1 lipase [Vibrio sp. Isolate24]MCG9682263.1 lipase [Vibrio sp. Isolate23]USD34199.1 lipase [Vibrio sp. SCSIO 43186]USD47271.1 lipase [Vibrio sp. SCSIO 43145]